MSGSPWGTIQDSTPLTRGVRFVSTAGHGGIMVSKSMIGSMSEAAQKRGMKYGTYLCYEEDCDWAIPTYELGLYNQNRTLEVTFGCLSRWNADYLLEIGREPEPEAYKFYCTWQEERKMRAEKHPDLIISAINTDNPEVIRVTTADDKTHLITKESYKFKWGSITRLSDCALVGG